MFFPSAIWLAIALVGTSTAWAALSEEVACPQGRISVAGEATPLRQVQAWAAAYQQKCPQVEFDWDDGGYSIGSSRVCDNHPVYGAVDMAALPNTFFAPQASTTDGWNFDCVGSDRQAVMVS